MINIVIPMAGQGSRFAEKGYSKPKPFIDVNGYPMIEHVLNNISLPNARYILIAREEHVQMENKIVENLEKKYNAKFVTIPSLSEGTACTLLEARRLFNNEEPLLVANSDQVVEFDPADFVNSCLSRNNDGSILTFKNPDKDKKWSYAKIDDNGYVTEVKEKVAISDNATVGIYFFSKGCDFVDYAIDMILKQDRVNGEFYTCPVYNYMIASGKKVSIYDIPKDKMHGIGTPDDLNAYLEFLKCKRSS